MKDFIPYQEALELKKLGKEITMKDFIPYQEALELKKLAFDEPCFGRIFADEGSEQLSYSFKNSDQIGKVTSCSAPTYSQAFRFFREKYGLHTWVGCKTLDNGKTVYIGNGRTIPNTLKDGFIVDIIPYEPKDTPEEAEVACLRKLIEIVKQK
jgi:hypothetical protein